ncbi:MAG TPA: alanine racemase [Mycobacteriales bacterium]|nr:alanine racemase [Mycobacteriales bacterium]
MSVSPAEMRPPAESRPQAEAVVDLDAIRANVALLRAETSAEVMAVVKADGYGHGMVPAARAALGAGATWLGACTIPEALALRAAGITAPVFAWLVAPGQPLGEAVAADVDLSAGAVSGLDEVAAAARAAGRRARVHLKVDTGLGRGGSTVADWPDLLAAAGRHAADGTIEVTGIWSHFAYADEPGHATVGRQIRVFREAVEVAASTGIRPAFRHLANSAATLTLPDAHFDMVRPGIAAYGLSPMPGTTARYGLRPAMTLRGSVVVSKRVPAGQGVSYGHAYTTDRETTLALVPLGYADGIPRAASNRGPLLVGGRRRTIAGRVCMDQVVVDVGDDVVHPGDDVVLFGPGDRGEPTADDWAEVLDTINYEIVTRIGARVPRTYRGVGA